ncbi:DNA polymerase/3'-5' exonuclease PolX [Phragmitibacter flavus]|uniref:DNA polymerase beta n=1 Tax=Phragmitibacter flavus TaxID=2576071 RepID=A0A5R8KK36_9BACT|nr:DNA polymerase/3'-5' exonuclease PolX [Phragmitibacter flavus]TLD71979.1 DNA polymerase/3'-5' exonuclease PolX [Phragmitibacter flavus]
MTATEAVTIFERIALLMELKEENPFKIRAYRTGAEVVENFPGPIMQLAEKNELAGIKGLGEALRDKLHEMATTGGLGFYDKLREGFSDDFFELFEVQGLGPKKIKVLHETFGISSVADLKRVCESGEVAKLAGFGSKTVVKLLESLAFRETHAQEFRGDQVAPLAEEILGMLRLHPEITRVSVAGSYRRGKETVHDLDFLVATREPKLVIEDFVGIPQVQSILGQGETKASVLLRNGLQCDLRAVSNAQFPFALQYFTGSKEHNVTLRQRALDRGLSLNEYGLKPVEGSNTVEPEVMEEGDIYRALGLSWIEPELRENSGEIQLAEKQPLPKLVELSNLRGVFHNHTTWSDGVASLEAMAEEAQELGLQYLGIADHSKSSFQANGLDAVRLLKQVEEIRALNATYDGGHFKIFAGSEVDILKDGSLDFDDEVLSQLDYVVASVHASFTLPEAEMTKRIIKAMENPYVTMLGHVSGRLLLQRPPYAVDIAAVIEAAAATGTIIELNASPWRLDMDWRWWKLAKEKGVKCSINPDAHSPRGLQDIFYGIRAARKGWLTREDIINCLPLSKVDEFLRAKFLSR